MMCKISSIRLVLHPLYTIVTAFSRKHLKLYILYIYIYSCWMNFELSTGLEACELTVKLVTFSDDFRVTIDYPYPVRLYNTLSRKHGWLIQSFLIPSSEGYSTTPMSLCSSASLLRWSALTTQCGLGSWQPDNRQTARCQKHVQYTVRR